MTCTDDFSGYLISREINISYYERLSPEQGLFLFVLYFQHAGDHKKCYFDM